MRPRSCRLRRSLLALGLAGAPLLLGASWAAAAEICVDARSPGGDGTRAAPFSSIQDGVWAASAGDVIKVAGTQYAESVAVETPNVTIEGGYAGATGDVYAGGGAGDFDTRDPSAYPTIVEGSASEPVFAFFGTGTSRLSGVTARGGERGVYAEGFPIEAHTLTVEGCVLEQNGNPGIEGAGVYSIMPVVLRSSILRDNVGDRGAGIMGEEAIVVEDSLVENNVGHGDHGGGIYATGDVRILGSVVRGNRTGESAGYGWGGGILVFEAGTNAVLHGNVVTGNYAPSHGSGVFVDDGAHADITNDLIVGNLCGDGPGAGLYVDGLDDSTGSTAELVNVTIAGHACSGGNAILLEQGSDVVVSSSIVWGNGGSSFAVSASSLTVRYSDVEDLASMDATDGGGNLQVDPLFGDPAGGDYHLRSATGRPDAGGACVVDGETSPCIDAGDPAGDFAAEPAPNGSRVDMGAYGNTALASCDPSAATVTTTAAVTSTGSGPGPGSTGTGTGAGQGGAGQGGASVGGDGDGDDGDDDGSGGSDGDAAAGDEGGCGCSVVGGPARRAGLGAGLGLIAAFCLARRRSRAPR